MKEGIKDFGQRGKKMLFLGIRQMQTPYYQGIAAQLAFFLFLSILPIFILLSQILGFFSMSLESVQNWLKINISGEGVLLLEEMLQYSTSGINSAFLALTALWAASRAQFAMIRITNYTLTDGKTTGNGYLTERLRAVRTILITLFTIAFALVVLVYGPTILKIAFGKVLGTELSAAAWMTLRWPLALGLYFFMISYNYYVLPSERVRYRDILPGSIFSSIGFLGATYLFQAYTTISTNYDVLYGSFSNFVVLLMWFWFMALIMCLGIVLNRVWWATRKTNTIPIAQESYCKIRRLRGKR